MFTKRHKSSVTEDQIRPIKCAKIDCKDDRIYFIDGLFPKISNLEYFPAEILSKIFSKVNDIDLMRLAHISYRFDSITKSVFKQRYTKNYFLVDGETLYEEQVRSLFKHFENVITSISARMINNIHDNHWIMQPKRVKKFKFRDCSFTDSPYTFSQHSNITHLTLRKCDIDNLSLSQLRNLQKLKIDGSVDGKFLSFKEMCKNNPQLESLIVYGLGANDMMEYVKMDLNHLKELHIIDRKPIESFDLTTQSMNRLESLGLSVGERSVPLLRELSDKCPNIKTLALALNTTPSFIDSYFSVDAIHRFKQVESLTLVYRINSTRLLEIAKGLPNLSQLFIEVHFDTLPLYSHQILALFQECVHLNKFCLDQIYGRVEQTYFSDIFHNDFLLATENRSNDVKIELKEHDKTVATVTKEAIVWRNKLVHWVGYAATYSQLNFHLLDYELLDISSLCTLCNRWKGVDTLIKRAVEKRYRVNGEAFIATIGETSGEAIQTFGQYVRNIEINLDGRDFEEIWWNLIVEHCGNVINMCVNEHFDPSKNSCFVHNRSMNFPELQHFEYRSNKNWQRNQIDKESIVFDVSILFSCQNLATLQFHSDVRLINYQVPAHALNNLMDLKFHTRNKSITEFLSNLTFNIHRKIKFKFKACFS
ncbi:uncharacterized protein LOC116343676 [Contarinia nasturtii]|uniref:uncharacterized protein LOC116343676 n=1 Tax=Contarinia nasturtii TaxID=265458 RepID=UPI0012D3D810|nr:uncharacterized protein LOC116343676 [Contarinia nasturtii]